MALTDTTFRKLQDIVGNAYCSRKKEDLVCYAYAMQQPPTIYRMLFYFRETPKKYLPL